MKDYFEDETDIEISEESEIESSSENTMRNTNTCVVCLNPRLYTWIFYHADMPTVVRMQHQNSRAWTTLPNMPI